MSDDDEPYDVGYGKPPKHTRFAKGQSGNPRGRPRKQDGARRTAVEQVFDETVGSVEVDGSIKSLSGREAMYRGLAKRALEGDVAAANALLKAYLASMETFVLSQTDQRVNGREVKAGGIMVVPAIMPVDEWEALAVPMQAELARQAAEDR